MTVTFSFEHQKGYIILLRAHSLMGSLSSKITRSSKMASSQDIQQFIKQAISQDKVVVFSKSYCPYCTMAKEVSNISKFLFFLENLKARMTHIFVFKSLLGLNGN